MTERPEPAPPFGTVVGAADDIETLLAGFQEAGTTAVGLEAGPGNVVGLHLGSLPRRAIRDAFEQAAVPIEAIAAPLALNVDQPDEGVVADIDAYLKLAADVGAKRLTLAAGVPQPGVDNGNTSATEGTGAAVPPDHISQRLAAVLGRGDQLDVQLVVENSGTAAGGEELAVILEAAHQLAPGAVAGAVWNVRKTVAAGEELELSAKLLRPYLADGAGYILCETAAAATALLDAVPAMADMLILIERQPERS